MFNSRHKAVDLIAPWIFVFIWSSGFVVSKFAFRSADSLYFLAIRLLLAAAILFLIAAAVRAPLTLTRTDLRSSVLIGICLHGFYLAGVWYAIERGAPAGFSSVITSLQPAIVSVLAVRVLGEPLSKRQISGLGLGLIGVALVVAPKFRGVDGFTPYTLALLVMALAGSTAATLLQKKIGHEIPLLAGTTYQFAAAAIALFAISFATGKVHYEITATSSWTMAWAVLVTSIAAILMLLAMLNRGSAARVSSLLYLVPPMAVLQAFVLFGEKVNAQSIIGMSMTALGVFLVISN